MTTLSRVPVDQMAEDPFFPNCVETKETGFVAGVL
jgi:hypothetical protein